LSERFNQDRHVIVEVAKAFAEHVALLKKDLLFMNLLNVPTPMVHNPIEILATLT
jgi:hypothetical protein